MSYTNTGRLSPNKYKQHEKQPDMKGSISLERGLLKQLLQETDDDMIVVKLSGWNRDGQYGPFISLMYDSYRKPEEQYTPAPRPAPAPPPADDSDIPF